MTPKTPDLAQLERDLQAERSQRIQAEQALRRANLELSRIGVLDQLTEIANRPRLDAYLEMLWEKGSPGEISLVICDIDFFDHYNTAYGTEAGDRCLYLVAQAISSAVRRGDDLAARCGGEEFAVVLPDTDVAGACIVAETIQRAIADLAIAHTGSEIGDTLTLSIGVATIAPGVDAPPELLIATADAAMYEAKRQGRNRIVVGAPSAA